MESGFTPESGAWSLESLRSLQYGSLAQITRSLVSGVTGGWRRVTPLSGVWSLESLRSLESGVWSHSGV